MQRFSKTIEETNRVGVDFLLTDIDAALTFLDVAGTTSNRETSTRNREHAHAAYATILHYVERVNLEGEQKSIFETRFRLLRDRLAQAGYSV